MRDWSDREILTIMDLHEHEGQTFAEIAERFRASRSQIAGLVRRINVQTDKTDVSPHLNGTMPRKWWKR